MNDDILDWGDEDELRKQLVILKEEHGDLGSAIDALSNAGIIDQLQMRRLKKKKLLLKDKISSIEDQLMPDIIA